MLSAPRSAASASGERPQRAATNSVERLFGWLHCVPMPPSNAIVVSGAREHNLKDVSLTLPRDALVVITGLSGSGKSSLAFDTIYAEGQRRYVESLSAYARQFLGPDGQARRRLDRGPVAGDLDRPEDDVAQPAVDGRHGHRDLRLPAPAVGAHRPSALPHLRQADRRAVRRADHRPGHGARGGHALHGAGAGRARAQGRVRQGPRGAARRGLLAGQGRRRAADARGRDRARQEVQARHLDRRRPPRHARRPAQAPGRLDRDGGRAGRRHDRDRDGARKDGDGARSRCTPRSSPAPTTARSIPELEPRIFSFNSPHGACERCTGLGSQMEIDPELVVPDPSLSIGEGALAPWAGSTSQYYEQITQAIAEKYDIDLEAPWESLDEDVRDLFLYGTNGDRDRGLLPQPLRAQALLRDALRGHRPQPRAPLPRDRLRPRAREDRGVHVAAAVPGVQGRAAAARVARGARRRRGDPRVHRAERQARAAVAGRRAADRRPSATSRG